MLSRLFQTPTGEAIKKASSKPVDARATEKGVELKTYRYTFNDENSESDSDQENKENMNKANHIVTAIKRRI